MRKRWLVLFNVFYLVSILFIVVLGPYYSNYSPDLLVDQQPGQAKSYSLSFTSSSRTYLLSTFTRLDLGSGIEVDFNSTQPVYIQVTEPSALYDKSAFGNGTMNSFAYHVPELGNYSVSAEGFSGNANITITVLVSTVDRSKPYAIWGQAMFYGGFGLLGISLAAIVMSYLGKEKPATRPNIGREKTQSKSTDQLFSSSLAGRYSSTM